MDFKNILTRIMGFLVIVIVLSMGAVIYTTNTTNVVSGNLTNLIGMSVIGGFGPFIIIFGLLISGGFFAVAGVRGQMTTMGVKDILLVVGNVIIVVIVLTFMGSIITYTNNLIAAAITASDHIGQVGFGIIPIAIYAMILAGSGWVQVSGYRKATKGGKRAQAAGQIGFVR
jgi:hypothetical protein